MGGERRRELEQNCLWKWNGQVYRFDILDADDMFRLITGLTVFKAALATLRQDGDADLEMAAHSGILRDFFDTIWGEGVGTALCGHSYASAYSLAYLDFMEHVRAQLDWLEETLAAAEVRYRKMGEALGWK